MIYLYSQAIPNNARLQITVGHQTFVQHCVQSGFKISSCPVVPDNQNHQRGNQFVQSGCPSDNLICQDISPSRNTYRSFLLWEDNNSQGLL